MIWLWIGLSLFSTVMFLLFWGACKVGAEADERMKCAFQKMMEQPSQDAEVVLHEAVTDDAEGT